MTLTMEEYCSFNLVSRMAIIDDAGVFLIKKIIDDTIETKLFLLYDFYVEIYYNYKKKKVLKADPVRNKKWLKVFYMGIADRFNFS